MAVNAVDVLLKSSLKKGIFMNEWACPNLLYVGNAVIKTVSKDGNLIDCGQEIAKSVKRKWKPAILLIGQKLYIAKPAI
jgi:hypothetical protein